MRFSPRFVALSLLTLLGTVGTLAGCGEGGVVDEAQTRFISNELEGKTFIERAGVSYISFDREEATYTECSDKGKVLVKILGKEYLVELTSAQLSRGLRTLVTKNETGMQMKCFVEPEEDGWTFNASGSLNKKTSDDSTGEPIWLDVIASDTLTEEEFASMESSDIVQMHVVKDGERVESESDRLPLVRSAPILSNVQAAVFLRADVARLTTPGECTAILKMPYVIRDKAVSIQWRNAKTPDGSDPYVKRGSGRSVAEVFGFNSEDEAWTVVVEGESYSRQETAEGVRYETAIHRAESLPMNSATLNDSGF